MKRRHVVAVLVLVTALTACSDGGLAEQRQQAAEALERWAAGDQPPAWDAEDPPTGIVPDSVEVSADGQGLVVTFVGSPRPASEPCGADYTGEAVESDLAVVVIVIERGRLGPQACEDIGATRTTMVTLAEPLGNRAVLDVQQGLPIEVDRQE